MGSGFIRGEFANIAKAPDNRGNRPFNMAGLSQYRNEQPLFRPEERKDGFLEAMKKMQGESAQKRLTSIINKYRSGKKLSFEELEFLRVNASEVYQEALRVTRQREELERRMRAARTKQDVDAVRSMAIAGISGAMAASDKSGAELNLVISKQYADAYFEYTKTAHYKDKPDSQRKKNEDRFEDAV
jgi:hypothetical protein